MKRFFLTILIQYAIIASTYAMAISRPYANSPGKNNVSITVHFADIKPGDHLMLKYSSTGLVTENLEKNFKTIILNKQKNGIYKFSFFTNGLNYIFLEDMIANDPLNGHGNGGIPILPFYFTERGDKIEIVVTRRDKLKPLKTTHDFNLKFSGNGSAKFTVRMNADSASYWNPDTTSVIIANKLYNKNNFENVAIQAGLKIIEKRRNLLTREAYELLKTDFIFDGKITEARVLTSLSRKVEKNLNQADKLNFANSYNSPLYFDVKTVPLKILLYSKNYTNGLIMMEKLKLFLSGDTSSTDDLYYLLKKKYQGILLERFIVGYFDRYTWAMANFNAIYYDAMKSVKNQLYLNYIAANKNRLTGNQAYNFNLPDTSGKMVKLSDFKGKIIFMDFWYTGCAGCSHFYQDHLSNVERELSGNPNIIFITICVDKDEKKWIKSIHSGKYTSPDVLNLYTNGEGWNNNTVNFYNVHEYPQPIIITKDQKILAMGGDEFLQGHKLMDTLKSLIQLN